MKISDQQLSAFIDNELSASEADAVRSAIAKDESLCDRLAALSMVDHYVKQAAEEAIRQPMPDRITALFEEPAEQPSDAYAVLEYHQALMAQGIRRIYPGAHGQRLIF